MAEYIKREDVLTIIKTSIFDLEYSGENDELQEEIKTIPAADVVERKLGSWRHYEGELTCSECAVTIYDDIMSLLGDDVPRFCPNCGAEMTGGE